MQEDTAESRNRFSSFPRYAGSMGTPRDPTLILRHIAREMAIIASTDISSDTKKRIFSATLWGVSEIHGKYIGCRFWSNAALARFRSDGSTCIPSLCHEHVVPRKVIVAKWLAVSQPTPEQTFALFERYGIGCVVLREEDDRLTACGLRQRMPEAFYNTSHPLHDDPWARYRVAGIDWTGPLQWRGDGLVQLDDPG